MSDEKPKEAGATKAEVPAPQAGSVAPVTPSQPHYWLWIGLWSSFLGLVLCMVVERYQTVPRQIDPASASTNTNALEYLPAEVIGGYSSQEITGRLLREIDSIKPDNCLFVGHQLAKKEVVEYLSALSRVAQVRLVIGPDRNGKVQISDRNSPLKKYRFTDVLQSPVPIHTQALFAFNNKERRAVAIVGTYPYDVQEASASEHVLVIIRDFKDCDRLYQAYRRLGSR